MKCHKKNKSEKTKLKDIISKDWIIYFCIIFISFLVVFFTFYAICCDGIIGLIGLFCALVLTLILFIAISC